MNNINGSTSSSGSQHRLRTPRPCSRRPISRRLGARRDGPVPTLIFHARNDARVPFDEGRNLAALIPDARFIPLESRNHLLLNTEPAWAQFLTDLRTFLAVPEVRSGPAWSLLARAGLTPSEHQVLSLIARGLDNGAIADALGKSEKTVRNKVSAIFSKLGVRTRAEAIVRARDAGVADPWDRTPVPRFRAVSPDVSQFLGTPAS